MICLYLEFCLDTYLFPNIFLSHNVYNHFNLFSSLISNSLVLLRVFNIFTYFGKATAQ